MECGLPTSRKLLVVVGSAGVDPWLNIEEECQRGILRDIFGNDVEFCWVQGSPALSDRFAYRMLNVIVSAQQRLVSSRKKLVKRSYKLLLNRFGLNALGASYLQRLGLRANFAPASPTKPERYVIEFPTQLSLAGGRLIGSLRLALERYDFDFLLRITSTCLPVPKVIDAALKGMPRNRVYAGMPLHHAGTNFVSGAAVLMSRDVVEGVVRRSSKLRFNLLEDVALGRIIQDLKLADLTPLELVQVTDVTSVPDEVSMGWPAGYAVRCKAEFRQTTRSAPVIEIMRAVHPHLR
jgi:hypothetical protein